jgi:hypothetical protein
MILRRRKWLVSPGRIDAAAVDEQTHMPADQSIVSRLQRDPSRTLQGCSRVLILGRTGSGKTTLARQISSGTNAPHVELDALYFGPGFSTAPLAILRERTRTAVAGDRWVADGNKSAVRDIVWPRADTIVWLDYPMGVSLWRLGKRALWRTSVLKAEAADSTAGSTFIKQFMTGAKLVLKALHSHMGQRHEYPRMLARPENQHIAVVRLRSPRATRRWLTRVLPDELRGCQRW